MQKRAECLLARSLARSLFFTHTSPGYWISVFKEREKEFEVRNGKKRGRNRRKEEKDPKEKTRRSKELLFWSLSRTKPLKNPSPTTKTHKKNSRAPGRTSPRAPPPRSRPRPLPCPPQPGSSRPRGRRRRRRPARAGRCRRRRARRSRASGRCPFPLLVVVLRGKKERGKGGFWRRRGMGGTSGR